MEGLPNLYIVLLTYGRLDYAERTIRSWLENLRYGGQISVHIADDGTGDGHIEALIEIAGGHPNVHGVTWTDAKQHGYGASYNLASQVTHNHAGVVIPLEDDWELRKPLNLDPLVLTLLDDNGIDCIRMGYIGFTQELRCHFESHHGLMFLKLDPDSAERHVFAGHPRIETVEYEKRVGLWNETLGPGGTEFEVCGRRAAREGVAWPVDLMPPTNTVVAHIGTIMARQD